MIFSLSGIFLLLYLFVIWALINMYNNRGTYNRAWLLALIGGLFIGIAPFIAIAYLAISYISKSNIVSAPKNNGVVYKPDGTYQVYKTEDTATAPSFWKVVFKVFIGIIVAISVGYGLMIVAVLIIIATKPAGSKTM